MDRAVIAAGSARIFGDENGRRQALQSAIGDDDEMIDANERRCSLAEKPSIKCVGEPEVEFHRGDIGAAREIEAFAEAADDGIELVGPDLQRAEEDTLWRDDPEIGRGA